MSDEHDHSGCPSFPAWARDGVLLQPDLLAAMLDLLPLQSDGLKRVCKAWRACLLELDKRIGLRPAGLAQSKICKYVLCASMPDASMLLVRDARGVFSFLDGTLNRVATFELDTDRYPAFQYGFALSYDRVALVDYIGTKLVAFAHSGAPLQESIRCRDDYVAHLWYPTLSACGQLFCIAAGHDHLPPGDYVYVFDASSLEFKRRFSHPSLGDVRGLAAHGEELYVSDCTDNVIKVLDFEGNVLRSGRSATPWRPGELLVHHDRIYAIEAEFGPDCEDNADMPEEYGRRVWVLSTACEVLQVYVLEVQGGFIRNFAVVSDRLVLFMNTGERHALRGV